MAERKSTNKYYPPDWDPSKGTLNKFVKKKQRQRFSKQSSSKDGKFPSGDQRNKKRKPVRFEMPFDTWCTSCNELITKGTRFNAEMEFHGKYLTSNIFLFKINCDNCKASIIIRNDPEHLDYVMVEGAKKKTESFDFDVDSEVVPLQLMSDDERKKIYENPMFKAEYRREDEDRTKQNLIPTLMDLRDIQDQNHENDSDLNALLRSRMREERKKAFQDGIKFKNLQVPLLPDSVVMDSTASNHVNNSIFDGMRVATLANEEKSLEKEKTVGISMEKVQFHHTTSTAREKKKEIRLSSIFGKPSRDKLIQSILMATIQKKKLEKQKR